MRSRLSQGSQRPSSPSRVIKTRITLFFSFLFLFFISSILTVEDLEKTTATTSWISSARVGGPCPLRRSGPCSAASGTSRCPKSLFVSRGCSCALPARGGGGARGASPGSGSGSGSGSAASTDAWAPLRSRLFRRRPPKKPCPPSRRQDPSSWRALGRV